MQMGTPPIAVTMFWKPAKSTTTKPSTKTSVRFSTVCTAHAAAEPTSPPTVAPFANAALKRVFAGAVVFPFVVAHAGTSTRESRGIEIISTRERSAATCRRIRSEEHTSELQSRENLVCRLLLEKKNK